MKISIPEIMVTTEWIPPKVMSLEDAGPKFKNTAKLPIPDGSYSEIIAHGEVTLNYNGWAIAASNQIGVRDITLRNCIVKDGMAEIAHWEVSPPASS